MGDRTAISWTDATWNCIRGCSRVSPGCEHCYAERTAHRFSGPGKPYEGLTRMTSRGPTWTGAIRLVPELLDWPLRKRKPLKVFVASMSDPFHAGVPDDFLDRLYGVMAAAQHHQFQLLTKRPERRRQWYERTASGASREQLVYDAQPDRWARRESWPGWPLPNVWEGTSVENQPTADERIPELLATPAAVRFVSYEPALGPVDFRKHGLTPEPECQCYEFVGGHQMGCQMYSLSAQQIREWGKLHSQNLDWIIVGGESGPHARPCDVAWIRSVVAQCRAAGTATWVKQLGTRPIWYPGDEITGYEGLGQDLDLSDPKGADPAEWNPDLRVQQFPA
jgi:protein gp37